MANRPAAATKAVTVRKVNRGISESPTFRIGQLTPQSSVSPGNSTQPSFGIAVTASAMGVDLPVTLFTREAPSRKVAAAAGRRSGQHIAAAARGNGGPALVLPGFPHWDKWNNRPNDRKIRHGDARRRDARPDACRRR